MRWKLSCRVGEITLCARRNSIVYPPRESNRDRLCGIIDTILAEQPKDFEVFLQKLEQQGIVSCARASNRRVSDKTDWRVAFAITSQEAEELTRLIARHLEGPLDRMEAEKEKAGPPV